MKLTELENYVVLTILEKVISCMVKDGKEYYDNGNFIMCLEDYEIKALKRAINKF